MGADEQLGGYARHRARFNGGDWTALTDEIRMEVERIAERNLGRDNRIVADRGVAPRFPYLDEDVVSFLSSVPTFVKADLRLRRGIGEKLLLRCLAWNLGLYLTATEPKRAIQFGSRIAKLENAKEKGGEKAKRTN
jgi:asparagine synthetase B (glutamine-hydrolysing)